MKLSTKILSGVVLLLLLALLAPLFLKGSDGKPIKLSDWVPNKDRMLGMARQAAKAGDELATDSMQSLGQLTDTAGSSSMQAEVEAAPDTLKASSGKMYKWQDENGRWHFSSQKPMETGNVALEDLPDVENVMDAPVDGEGDDSMMDVDFAKMLEKVQRAAADRDR